MKIKNLLAADDTLIFILSFVLTRRKSYFQVSKVLIYNYDDNNDNIWSLYY